MRRSALSQADVPPSWLVMQKAPFPFGLGAFCLSPVRHVGFPCSIFVEGSPTGHYAVRVRESIFDVPSDWLPQGWFDRDVTFFFHGGPYECEGDDCCADGEERDVVFHFVSFVMWLLMASAAMSVMTNIGIARAMKIIAGLSLVGNVSVPSTRQNVKHFWKDL